MSEKLLSERDAYELADILNAKGIDKFAEMAENIARNQALDEVEHILVNAGLPTINKKCQALRKPPSQEVE